MAEIWLKSCVKVPYPNPLSRLDQYSSSVPNGGNPYGNSMEFIVNHVVAGMFSASNQPNDVMRARGNSWPITLFRDGHAEQHFPLKAMCWHAGAKANYRGIGIEWEGGTNHSGPTAAQKAKGIEVESEIARIRNWVNIKKGLTGREHNDFMSTGCPGFPIPWAALASGTKVQAPAPTGIWPDVVLISNEVTLQKDTNLVQLPSMIFVKKLVKGTKLVVKGLWKDSHYITVYSYDKRISNGFAKSATIAPAPTPPPPTSSFWDDVKQIDQSVTLYEDTNLVTLPGATTVIKKLVKGTRLAVKGIWNNTHYITVYSYDKKIQSGFAASATVAPSVPPATDPCEAEKREIASLRNQVITFHQQIKIRDDVITNLRSEISNVISLLKDLL